MENELFDESLLDRVIKEKHCPTGFIDDLSPSAFEWRKGENGLSFTDRQQLSPSDAIKRFNSDASISGENNGKWTVALSAGEAMSVADSPEHVYFDDPINDPAHILLLLPSEMKTRTQKRNFRSTLCGFAT